MIDIRYVGITLIGVFLALAVGLMTGSALGSPDRRDAAYEMLRNQFELLRARNQEVQDENDAVRRQLASRDRALRELLPLVVRGRLGGAAIGVVVCGPLEVRPFWGDLEDALRLAGTRIGPVVHIPDRLEPLPEATRYRLGVLWQPALPPEPEPYEAAGWITLALARGAGRERLEELARAAGMRLSGDPSVPVRRLLLLTAAPDDLRAAAVAAGDVPEIRVAEAARAAGIRLVAAEPEAARASALEPLRRRGVSTVDNVDTPGGQISVVLALAGAEGHFGSRPGATRPTPPLESP